MIKLPYNIVMQSVIESKIQERVKTLREHHIPLTTTRLVLLRFLATNRGHYSAEDIYQILKEEYPSLSIATVYNNMSLFARLGIVQELRIEKDKIIYDTYTEPHAHFLCLKCGQIYDIDTSMKEFPEEIDGHAVHFVHTYYFGICKNCRQT